MLIFTSKLEIVNNQISIVVEDKGIGMSADMIADLSTEK